MENREVVVRLRGAISGEELGTVTVTSFDQLQNRCGRGVRFLDGAREIATQADLDSLDGVALGAMVGIGVERQRLSFNIGQTAARSAGVGISSKLLRLAGSVR